MAMAKPQPPPQTSFHESPPPDGSGSRTEDGERIGDFSGKAPGMYPHIYTTALLHSSIFTHSSPSLPFIATFFVKRKAKTTTNQSLSLSRAKLEKNSVTGFRIIYKDIAYAMSDTHVVSRTRGAIRAAEWISFLKPRCAGR